jgi:hypothetical protein
VRHASRASMVKAHYLIDDIVKGKQRNIQPFQLESLK